MVAMSQSRKPEAILITGASSGIGAALAGAYARPGVTLALTGRSTERLDAVAADGKRAGATVVKAVLDVSDRAAMAAWISKVDRETPLDLVIANAGVSGRGQGDPDPVRTMLRINVEGVLNTVDPIIPAMIERASGHLAIVSSLAGFRGMPTAPGYTASKAAVRCYGEGLRGKLMRRGITVSVVCPGFVRTPMTDDNPFPMPLLMEPEQAAAIIRRGLKRKKARIAFPFRLYLAMRLLAALPPAWADPWLQRFPGKE